MAASFLTPDRRDRDNVRQRDERKMSSTYPDGDLTAAAATAAG